MRIFIEHLFIKKIYFHLFYMDSFLIKMLWSYVTIIRPNDRTIKNLCLHEERMHLHCC